jgi:hypothetical protein
LVSLEQEALRRGISADSLLHIRGDLAGEGQELLRRDAEHRADRYNGVGGGRWQAPVLEFRDVREVQTRPLGKPPLAKTGAAAKCP